MQLISCRNCGLVLDAEVLSFPKDIYRREKGREFEVDPAKATWHSGRDRFVPITACPVRNGEIMKPLPEVEG